MAAGVEDGVVIFLLDAIEAHRPAKLGFGVGVLFEPTGDVGLEVRLVALGIERRPAALGGSEGDLGAGVLEDIVRRRQFLQPETSLATCVAELVVRGKNHQDFHDALRFLVVEECDPRCCVGEGLARVVWSGRCRVFTANSLVALVLISQTAAAEKALFA
jgi:hypothetical protein